MAPAIDRLQRALKIKSNDVADLVLQRHLMLLKESQFKVELDRLRRKGKTDEAAQKLDELEKQTRLLGSYDFQIESRIDEALDLHRQIKELEAEELQAQLQDLQSDLKHAMEGTGEIRDVVDALRRRIEAVSAALSQKKSEVLLLQDKESPLVRAWRENLLAAAQTHPR